MQTLILYASIAGTNFKLAQTIQSELTTHQITNQLVAIDEFTSTQLATADIVIVVPYTYDRGSLPEEALDFYDELNDQDWSNKHFAVAGVGDRFYGNDFGKAITTFVDQLEKAGARQLVPAIKVDRMLSDDNLQAIKQLAETIKALH